MPDDPIVIQLVTEVLDSGRSPEEVCRAWPDQLDEVRRRAARCRKLVSRLDDLFSPPDSETAPSIATGRLPTIPLYEVLEVIGEGGTGVVYSAQHLRLKRTVAIKMLRSGVYASPAELGRFSLEAEAVAGLQHPHIVQIYELGEADGRPYFTMEFLEGGSLAQKLNGAPLPSEQAARYLITLALATAAAHRAGIVHRDLKPSNVLLTKDGQLKISDFGLARRMSAEDGLTHSGGRIGTPSYMAPEQATGHTAAIGPSADIYALGAILYEMLTGRPPFKGATAADTERQVINDDPASPRRLNTSVPRDLETICLKCLRKDPGQRCATAAHLAEDVERHLRGEPIHARPTGHSERAVKWVRRHKAATIAIAAGFVTAVTILSATAWIVSQKMSIASAAAGDLHRAATLQKKGDWTSADEAIDRAAIRLGSGGPAALRSQLQQERRESELVSTLEDIRDKNEGDAHSLALVNDAYARVFHNAGLGGDSDAPAAVAGRIGAMNITPALIAALDDWTACILTPQRRDWILAVLRIVDHDPTGWRDHMRDPALWGDVPRLAREVEGADISNQPVPFIIAVAKQLELSDNKAEAMLTNDQAVSLLSLLQRGHPGDFWANIALGNALANSDPDSACQFFRAAVSIQPNNFLSHNNLGSSLRLRGHEDQAMQEFRRALELDPDADIPIANFSLGLEMLGKKQEALDTLEAALRRERPHPNSRWAYGEMLLESGRYGEALEQYRQYAAGAPPDWSTLREIRRCLIKLNRYDEMLANWRNAIDTASPFEDDYDGYAEYALFTGQQTEYERVRRILLDRFRNAADPSICSRIARACLLQPISGKDLETASALADRAAASLTNRSIHNYYYFQFCRGLALYRQGRNREARELLSQVGGNSFLSGALAISSMMHEQAREHNAALKDLALAVVTFDWSSKFSDEQTDWMYQILRREAEKMVVPNLPAFLQGSYQPTGNDERVIMTAELQFEGRTLARAQLWRDTLSNLPNPPAGYRFRGASVAALVSASVGTDVTGLSVAERAQWRADALRWLQADLDRFEHRTASAEKAQAHAELALWLNDTDLANVRGFQPTFTAEEGSQWNALWERVQSLYSRTM
jgi:serine/threonine protein kinase/tetratricopeptide (TPR) repeat protein